MAAESGVDLRSLSGSGPGGRIVKRDIEAAMQAQQSTATAGATGAVVKFPVRQAGITEASPYRDEPASEMRRIIAKRLVTSLGPIPHFFLTTEIEMDRAAEMRRQHQRARSGTEDQRQRHHHQSRSCCPNCSSASKRFLPGQERSLLRTGRRGRRRGN